MSKTGRKRRQEKSGTQKLQIQKLQNQELQMQRRNKKMAILVTGGAGYIGSHTVVELQSAGYDVVVVDNLCNSSEKALDRVSKITGKPVKFYKADILDRDALNEVFDKEEIDSCIHFAGLKQLVNLLPSRGSTMRTISQEPLLL